MLTGHLRAILAGKSFGRRRIIQANQIISLTSTWTRIWGSESFSKIIFGVTSSICSLFIRSGRRILIQAIKCDTRLAIQKPSLPEISSLQQAFSLRQHILKEVYFVTDGVKLMWNKVAKSLYKIYASIDGYMKIMRQTWWYLPQTEESLLLHWMNLIVSRLNRGRICPHLNKTTQCLLAFGREMCFRQRFLSSKISF